MVLLGPFKGLLKSQNSCVKSTPHDPLHRRNQSSEQLNDLPRNTQNLGNEDKMQTQFSQMASSTQKVHTCQLLTQHWLPSRIFTRKGSCRE